MPRVTPAGTGADYRGWLVQDTERTEYGSVATQFVNDGAGGAGETRSPRGEATHREALIARTEEA